ncbi:MAG TPA: hypothetical protein VMV72_06765 [Verrucomicrobiae bacterium]|nr:hypothetical protein [Verrucomicrobiae bacterium]
MTIGELIFILAFALAGVGVAILACRKSMVTVGAWIGLFTSVYVLVEIDNRLRMAHNDLFHGMPDSIAYPVFAVIGIVFLTLLYRGAAAFKSIEARLLVVLLQFVAACVLTFLMMFIFGWGEGP